MIFTWDDTSSAAAEAEGWCISLADGSLENIRGDRPWQLQRLDEVAIFDSDQDAWDHVIRCALRGSELHFRALGYLRTYSRPEYDAIARRYEVEGVE
jgi:hypothetical protein